MYIDQLDLSNAEQDDYPIGNCRNVKGHPIKLNHINYERGLGTFTNSMLHINLNKGSEKFSAIVGFDDEVLGQGCHPIEFIVYADDKIVWRSGAMKPIDSPKQIEVNLKGNRTICFQFLKIQLSKIRHHMSMYPQPVAHLINKIVKSK